LQLFADTADIDKALKLYLDDSADVKYEIISTGRATKDCEYPLTVSSKLPIKPSSRWIFTIKCPSTWSASISTKTYVKYPFYITTKDIYKGDILNISNAKRDTRWYSKHISGAHEVFGFIAKKTIKKSRLIKPKHLIPNYLIKKNQKISVTSGSRFVSLTISAIALESGQKYDIIKLMNPDSKKTFYAKIMSSNSAIVE
jgi:flagella basal body P-ring formation protein FlgA